MAGRFKDKVKPANDRRGGLLERLRLGLSKTRSSLTAQLERLFPGSRGIGEDQLDELEEILFTADIGVTTTQKLIGTVEHKVRQEEVRDPEALRRILRDEILALLEIQPSSRPLPGSDQPLVVMVTGVNGVGKTTTIGKAAYRYRAEGKRVMLVAADTFRAAAVEQLVLWGERVGAEVIHQQPGADPSAVVFDALTAATARQVDVVLIDTAGRLHTRTNLMEELQKVQRVAGRKVSDAPHQKWLVLDATTGQNALSQAEIFHRSLGITDIVLTKLDGTAKGGIVIGITDQLRIPIRYIGIGEKVDDLEIFRPEEFVRALFD